MHVHTYRSAMTRSHLYPIFFFFVIVLTLSQIIGCNSSGDRISQVDEPDVVDMTGQTDTLVADSFVIETGNADASSKEYYVFRDTTMGQFVNGVTDTLVLESAARETDWDWVEYTMYSLRGSVKTIEFGPHYCVLFANLGDLNQNGTDELLIGFGSISINSYAYRVLTYHRGVWHILTETIALRGDELYKHIEKGDLFRKSNRTGYMYAKTTRDVYVDEYGNRIPEPIDFESDEYVNWWGRETVDTLIKLLSDGPVYKPYRKSE